MRVVLVDCGADSAESRASRAARILVDPMPSAGLALTTVAEFGRLGLQAWVGREDFNQAIVGKNPWPSSPSAKPNQGFFTS